MSEIKSDVLIIGAGPSGIFTALELIRKNSNKTITIVEQGRNIDRRHCPKNKTGKCVNCKPYCNITTGFSGAGAFSDGKLSLSPEVGGDLPELIGYDTVQELIDYTDGIYLDFGADKKIEGANSEDVKVKEIRRRAIAAGLKLVDCPIRHLGTEKAHEVYSRIEKFLIDNGVNILFDTSAGDLIINDGVCEGAHFINNVTKQEFVIKAERVIVAVGRVGADWLDDLCRKYGIKRRAGVVDIGVRVECRNEVMEEVNDVLYESKLIGYVPPYNDKVRTFCQNPGGFVSQENYEGGLAVVNGHSFKDKNPKTPTSRFCRRTTSAYLSISRSNTQERSGNSRICLATDKSSCNASAISLTANAPGKKNLQEATCAPRFPTRLQVISRQQCLIVRCRISSTS